MESNKIINMWIMVMLIIILKEYAPELIEAALTLYLFWLDESNE